MFVSYWFGKKAFNILAKKYLETVCSFCPLLLFECNEFSGAEIVMRIYFYKNIKNEWNGMDRNWQTALLKETNYENCFFETAKLLHKIN